MEDISKRTVSILLVIAVVLTIIFTWNIITAQDQVVVVQQSAHQDAKPNEYGKVRLFVGTGQEEEKVQAFGNLRLAIIKPNGG